MLVTKSQFIPSINVSAVTTSASGLELDVSVAIVGTVGEAFVAEDGVVALTAVETAEGRTYC